MKKCPIKRCNEIIQQGKRKGKKCTNISHSKCGKCAYHNENSSSYKQKIYVAKRYENLIQKIQKIYNDEIEMVDTIDREIKLIEKRIYGMRRYINDRNLKRIPGYKYVIYQKKDSLKIVTKKITTAYKRLGFLKDQRKQLILHVDQTKRAKDIFLE